MPGTHLRKFSANSHKMFPTSDGGNFTYSGKLARVCGNFALISTRHKVLENEIFSIRFDVNLHFITPDIMITKLFTREWTLHLRTIRISASTILSTDLKTVIFGQPEVSIVRKFLAGNLVFQPGQKILEAKQYFNLNVYQPPRLTHRNFFGVS